MMNTIGVVFVLLGCSSSTPPRADSPATNGVPSCGNAILHEQFEKELAAAQADPEPEKRADAVCKVAHDWGIEDCSQVTPESLNLP